MAQGVYEPKLKRKVREGESAGQRGHQWPKAHHMQNEQLWMVRNARSKKGTKQAKGIQS